MLLPAPRPPRPHLDLQYLRQRPGPRHVIRWAPGDGLARTTASPVPLKGSSEKNSIRGCEGITLARRRAMQACGINRRRKGVSSLAFRAPERCVPTARQSCAPKKGNSLSVTAHFGRLAGSCTREGNLVEEGRWHTPR